MTINSAPLTVSVHGGWRYYGGANPTFTNTIAGLVNGDTVTVTDETTAVPTSPVGTYPVTATVSGAKAVNYAIYVADSTLGVHPVVLHIAAKNEAVTYGQTPAAPTAYNLLGFVNGETASVVSGVPALSTTVTSRTPVGVYQIGVNVGMLTAANYIFTTWASGMGNVQVYKAHLKVTANDLSMHQGGLVPSLTYTLNGFLNGDTAANAMTGAPQLTTTVSSSSRPGRYWIIVGAGTLASNNYVFDRVNGILTVQP